MDNENNMKGLQWGTDIYHHIKKRHELAKRTQKNYIVGINGPKGIGKKELIKLVGKEVKREYVDMDFKDILENASLFSKYKSGNYLLYIENTVVENGLYHQGVERIMNEINKNKLEDTIWVFSSNGLLGKNTSLNTQFRVFSYGCLSTMEKIMYAKEVIKKCKNKWGLDNISMPDKSIEILINHYTKEPGKNYLSILIENLFEELYCEKEHRCEKESIIITNKIIFQILGTGCYVLDAQIAKKSLQGIGAAWTKWGGMLLPIEMVVTKGKGNIIYSGTIGDTMKDSIQVIFSYFEINYKEWQIQHKFFQKHNIHINIYEQAIYKDGASAGLAFFVKLLCVIKNIKFREPIAFTGEVSLEGRVLRVGGLKEKLCSFQDHNIYKVVLPKQSWPEYQLMPTELRNSLSVHFIDNVKEIKKITLEEVASCENA